jgi:hypothetical protein
VIVARHEARALAEAEGLAGIRRSLAALVDKVPGAPQPAEREAVEARSDGGHA